MLGGIVLGLATDLGLGVGIGIAIAIALNLAGILWGLSRLEAYLKREKRKRPLVVWLILGIASTVALALGGGLGWLLQSWGVQLPV